MGLDFGIEWTIESLFAAEPKTSDADGNAVKHNNWWNTNMLKKYYSISTFQGVLITT